MKLELLLFLFKNKEIKSYGSQVLAKVIEPVYICSNIWTQLSDVRIYVCAYYQAKSHMPCAGHSKKLINKTDSISACMEFTV